MTKTTTYLLLMLITIVAGTYFFITCCSECGIKPKEPVPREEITVVPEATAYPFALSDGDFSLSTNDNYNFNVSTYGYLNPLSDNLLAEVARLKAYLAENGNKVVNITGYYTGQEENTSAYPNLGLARAIAVKDHFVGLGIPSAQINTMGQLKNEMVPKENIYLGPVAYGMDEVAEDDSGAITALYEKITADPLVLYFDTAQTSIALNAEQRQKVADISRYLDKVPDATVYIVGHTDNTGNAETNVKLGLDRANFAKAYLMRNNISEGRISVSSKGQSQPLESNATEAGRAKNRRTIVTLN